MARLRKWWFWAYVVAFVSAFPVWLRLVLWEPFTEAEAMRSVLLVGTGALLTLIASIGRE